MALHTEWEYCQINRSTLVVLRILKSLIDEPLVYGDFIFTEELFALVACLIC